jgi:integrase
MTGHIRARGKGAWEIKYDAGSDPVTGKRRTRYATVKGGRRDAQRELVRLLHELDTGKAVDPAKTTVAEHTRAWLAGARHLAGKTRERYQALAEQQIIPHLGAIALQKLRPPHLEAWHKTLLESGGFDGAPLSARTVGHCHRLLHVVLAAALRGELVGGNVAAIVHPPTVKDTEIAPLTQDEIAETLARLAGHRLSPIIATALGTGLRRGEICALRWRDVDFAAAELRVERSVEETRNGLKIKGPKTKHGRRTISLPGPTIAALQQHRRDQTELRLKIGIGGRPEPDDLLFTLPDGSMWNPDYLSRCWRRTCAALGLPAVGLHALRHSHASVLIAKHTDPLTVSRRLGHADPAFTLRTYAHLFRATDRTAADKLDDVLGGKPDDALGGKH